MKIGEFCSDFEDLYPSRLRNEPTRLYGMKLKFTVKKFKFRYYFFDPLPDVEGMLSVKKQKLLKLAYSFVGLDEGYLEIGTWKGKSLIAAMHENEQRPTFACDNFSEFDREAGQQVDVEADFKRNLERYQLDRHVTFHNDSFTNIFTTEKLPIPIGVYFYDGAHDEESQYQAIRLAEPFLSDEALVLVDDWRFARDSQSYAKAGTERAMSDSPNTWELLYELPARFNGDRAMWWNGVAILGFRRTTN